MYTNALLKERLNVVTPTNIHGTFYRGLPTGLILEFGTKLNPLDCTFSARDGERYTRKGGHPSLYASFEMATVEKELAHLCAPGEERTITLFYLKVELAKVLDLSDQNVRDTLMVSDNDLNCDWDKLQVRGVFVPTQHLADIAVEQGFEAIIYPSVRNPDGKNVVIFCKQLKLGSIVKVLDANRNFVYEIRPNAET